MIVKASQIKFDDETDEIIPADQIRFDDELPGGSVVSADKIVFDDEPEGPTFTAPDDPRAAMLDAGPVDSDAQGNLVPLVTAGAKGGVHALTSTAPGMANSAARQFVDRTRTAGERGAAGVIEAAGSGPLALIPAAASAASNAVAPEYTQNFLKNLSDRLGVGADVWKASGKPLELPPNATEGERRAWNVGQSLGLTVAAVPFGAVGGPIALGIGTSGQSYNEMLEAGVEPERAQKASIIKGIAEFAPELLSFRIGLSKTMPFLQKAIYGQVSELLGESGTGATQLGADLWAMNPGATKEQIAEKYASEIGDTLKETAIQTMIQAPIQSAGFHAVTKLPSLKIQTQETITRIQEKLGMLKPAQAAGQPLSATTTAGRLGQTEGVAGQEQPVAQPGDINIEEYQAPRGALESEAFPGAGLTHEDIFALDPDGPEMQRPGIAAYRLKHDQLTGLRNRAEFFRKLDAKQGPTVVVQFDLDKFKAINDFFSHEAGDTVLRKVGEAVKALKLEEFIHRTGGEEFEAIGFKDEKHAQRAFDKLTRYLASAKIEFEDTEVGETLEWEGIPFSHGIAIGNNGKEARVNADVALKRSKQERAELGYRPEGVELSPLTRLGSQAERVYYERRKAEAERKSQGDVTRSEALSGRRLDPWAKGDKFAVAPVHAKDFAYLQDLRSIISGMEAPGKHLGDNKRSVSGLPDHLKNTGIVKADADTISNILKGIPVTKNQYEKVRAILENHKAGLGHREDVTSIENESIPASSLNVGDVFYQGGSFRKVVDVAPWENAVAVEDGTGNKFTLPADDNIQIDRGSLELLSAEKQPTVSYSKQPPTQTGFDLGLKGKDLRAPELESKPVSMDELPLGKATNEAKDREAQEKIHWSKLPPSAKIPPMTPKEGAGENIPTKKTSMPGSGEYVYHGTSEGAARRIQKEGLRGDVRIGSDTVAPISFSNNEQYAQSFADRKSARNAMLRVKRTPDIVIDDRVRNTAKNYDLKSDKPIPADAIEIKTSSGEWVPIQNWDFDEKQAIPTGKPESKPEGGNLFKDSKVQELVYHGTFDEFVNFDPTKSPLEEFANGKKAIYFTSDPDIAKTYGDNIFKAYLNMRRPLDITEIPIWDLHEEFNPDRLSIFIKTDDYKRLPDHLKIEANRDDETVDTRYIMDELDDLDIEYALFGYKNAMSKFDKNADGIIVRNVSDALGEYKRGDVFIVFDAEQVKSISDTPRSPKEGDQVAPSRSESSEEQPRTKNQVEKALFSGKPVTDEELKAYPDLAKRYGKKAAVPREQTVTKPSEGAASAKEPWQMSEAEYSEYYNQPRDDQGRVSTGVEFAAYKLPNGKIVIGHDHENIPAHKNLSGNSDARGSFVSNRPIKFDSFNGKQYREVNPEEGTFVSLRELDAVPDKSTSFITHAAVVAKRYDPSESTLTSPKQPVDVPRGTIPKTQYSFSPGSRYEGMRQGGEAMPEGTEKEPPLRREPIIQKLMSKLEAALYEGRVKNKKAGGFYKQGIEEVRSRKKSDLETVAHEVAHMLDERIPDIRAEYKSNDAFNAELKAVSYDKKKTSEGFAEFVRLWMTNKSVAAERVPQFNAWFNEFVKTSKYGKALAEAQKNMHEWFEQGEVKKLASKIGEQTPINEILDGMGDHIRQSIFDDLHGVYKMEREQTGGIAPVGAYETVRLARAAYSITHGAILYGHPVALPDGNHVYRGKGLVEILETVSKSLDEWTWYAVARSANELMQQGRENLITPSEIQAGLKLETPAFRQAFDEYQTWNKGILDFAEAKGLINPANRALWRRLEYLPFKREGQRGTGRKAKGVEGNWNGIRMLTGGTGNIRDVLLNMTSNAANLISESLKNEARVKIADLAEKTKGGAKFMAKIPKDTRPVTVDKEQVRRFIYETLGIDKADVDAGNVPEATIKYIAEMEKSLAEKPDFLVFWQMGQAPKGSNVVAVLRGGEPDFYEVADPILYRSIASLNRAPKNWLVKYLGAIKHVGQSSITLSIDFMTANIARDTAAGGVMSRSGFRPFIDSIRGMMVRLSGIPALGKLPMTKKMREALERSSQDYKDFIANGGGQSSYMLEESGLRKHLEKFYAKKGINYQTVIDTPAKILYFLDEITNAFEVSTRIGEFKRAKEKGASARHAAYQAREVSTDFAMRGDSEVAGFFYDTVMFLKAGVNGMDRLYRGLAHDPQKGHIAVKTGLLALMSAALYAINKDDEEYKDLPDWDKDNHWHFFIGGKHFRYPKIWEIGAVASVAERTMEQLFDKDSAFKKYPQDVVRIVTNLFKINLVPQALNPLYEQATNRRGFTGSPIEQQWMKDLQPWARAYPHQSQLIQDLGMAERNLPRGLQVSPARIEALLHGYFNTWATYGLMLSDAAVYDNTPDLRPDDYPGLRRFYAAKPARRTKYEEMYYDMLQEVTEVRRTMSLMNKYDNPEIAAELEKKYASELENYGELHGLQEQLRNNRKDTIAIMKDKSMSPEEKRAALDKLIEEKNKMLKETMTSITRKKPPEMAKK